MKLGLALGGGGSKGSYQIGVLKALIEEKLIKDLKVVAGTSIGALNACLVMEKLSFKQMKDIWYQIDNELMFNEMKRFKKDRLGLYEQKKMYEILIENQDKNALINSTIKGYVVASKIKKVGLRHQIYLSNLEEETFHLNKMEDPHKAVLASSSVPIVFGPTKLGDNYYVDGGLLNNLPINVLVKEKCNVILTVGLSPGNNFENYDNDNLIIDFTPKYKLSKTILGSLNFNEIILEERMEQGYTEASNLIKKLKEINVIKNGSFNKKIKGIYNYDTLV